MSNMNADKLREFREDGYVVLENFATEDEVDAMRAECHQLVAGMNPADHNTAFSTTHLKHGNDYFLESADRISYFFEEGALDEGGNLKVDKHCSLNKIGHALHQLSPAFRKFTFSDKVKSISKALDFKDPIVCQSMYIFKQAGIGGEVVPHQDATYLFAETNNEMGLWIALEDTTLENGCLWFIPGSQKGGLYDNYRMVRDENRTDNKTIMYRGERPDYEALGTFVPVPVKKGDLIVIDGHVVHKSERNESASSRHIYTFHMYDQAGGQWSNENWIQPTDKGAFMKLYES